MVASVILPVDIGGMPGEERQLPVWMRGIAERNKLSNSIREPGQLGHTDDESYQRSLMKRLGHADVHARMVAAQCLAAASPKGSRAALNALLCIPKGRVINRSGATLSLSLGKKGVRDPSQQVQAACVESAGVIAEGSGDQVTCTVLLEMLKSRDWTVRSAVTKALAMVCNAESREWVLTSLCSLLEDGEWYSKISAADTAWHIQARLRGAPEPTGSRIAEALGASIKDKDWAVRKSAVVAMAALVNKDEALPALLSRANDRDWRVRKAVLENLAPLYKPGSDLAIEEAVMPRLEDSNVNINRGEYDEAALCDKDVKIAAIACLCRLSIHGQQWVRSALEVLQLIDDLPMSVKSMVFAAIEHFPEVVHAEYVNALPVPACPEEALFQ